jgi:hypothetical protein
MSAIFLILLGVLMGTQMPAAAGTGLTLCPAEVAAPGAYAKLDGTALALRVGWRAEGPAGCGTMDLSLASGQVRAAWLAPPAVAGTLERGAVLVSPRDRPLSAGYWEALEIPAPRVPAPTFLNLLDSYTPAAFGREERVAWRRDDTALEITCRAGRDVAGVTLPIVEGRHPGAAANESTARADHGGGRRSAGLLRGLHRPLHATISGRP